MTAKAFTAEQRDRAELYLATTVAAMMGRKFEEEDWSKVYAAAKGFPASTWSNFDIDVMSGNLGVEHKMYGRSGAASLLACCGRSFLHPAGTRAIRFPTAVADATDAARDVLRQYGKKIKERTQIVKLIHRYHHARYARADAITRLTATGMGRDKAATLVPDQRRPVGHVDDEPDMRFGWLLWRRDLAEFLYFEVPMVAPRPQDFVGEWHERPTRGRRLPSKNLWIYRKATGIKEFSITNEAGVKVQPYFTVPPPHDPNLYHFRVQGEQAAAGSIRVWLTHETAQSLRALLGDTSPESIASFVQANLAEPGDLVRPARAAFEPQAVQILVPIDTYRTLRAGDRSVSDEHAFRLLLDKPG